MTIGDRLRIRREQLGLTQKYVAEQVGITKQSLYKYEKGIVKNIPLTVIDDLATVLGVSPEYLTGWSDKAISITKQDYLTKKEQEHLQKYRELDAYGRELVDTITDKEWERVRESANYLPPLAAHNDNAMDPEEQELTKKDLERMK